MNRARPLRCPCRDDLGHIAGWTPARAERAAEATARMLLGSVLSVRRQSPDEVRREQFWREVEQKQARPKTVLRRVR